MAGLVSPQRHGHSLAALIVFAAALLHASSDAGGGVTVAHGLPIDPVAYPTITPRPLLFTATRGTGGTTASVDVAGITVTLLQSPCGQPSAGTQAAVEAAADRLRAAIAAGVRTASGVDGAATLPYLRVRYAPLRNSSDPRVSAAIPAATVAMGAVSVTVTGDSACTDGPDAARLDGIDETYELSAGAGGQVAVAAPTYVGASHALTSLAQLVVWDGTQFILPNLPLQIADGPRFAWRGILVDTARHFLPVATLKHVLDGMALLKLNVLHWHIVDGASFPLESKLFPQLSGQGALHPTLVYSQDDVADVVHHALMRGIRVVPEIDVPGHAAAVGFGLPNVITHCASYVASATARYNSILERMINVVSLDPTLPATMQFVDSLLGEVASLFPDTHMHIGGDEVDGKCWLDVPHIVRFMGDHGMATSSELQAWFTSRAVRLVEEHGKVAVLWEEAFSSGAVANTSAVINVWKSDDIVPDVAQSGHASVVSFGAYLDRQTPVPSAKTHWMFFDTWTDMYGSEGMMNATLLAQPGVSGVLGGEASSWGENVDAASMDERLFHRLPPVAERLWSDASVTDLTDARNRMAELRCKMLRNGFMYGPVYPDHCDSTGAPSAGGGGGGGDGSDAGALDLWRNFAIIVTVLCVALIGALVFAASKLRELQAAQSRGTMHVALDDPTE